MKKAGALFIITLLILIPIFLKIAIAESAPGLPPSLEQDPNELIEQTKNQTLSSKDYLMNEWGKQLDKTAFGRIVLYTINLPKSLSPVFKLLIGIEYELSWFFVLAFIFWVFIVVLIYRAIKDPFQFKWWIALLVSIIIPAIGAQFGSFEKGVLFILPLFVNKWILFAFILIIIISLFVYIKLMQKYGKIMAEKMKKEKEQRRELKEETVEKINDIKIKSI